jgi:hypothetical protein
MRARLHGSWLAAVGTFVALGACDQSSDPPLDAAIPVPDASHGTPDAALPNQPDAALPEADAEVPDLDAGPLPIGVYVPLVTAHWSLEPGTEGYVCASKTLTQDVYVSAIRPISPVGTHHTTISLVEGGGPDDPGSPCGAMFGDFYASGVGTGELVLPTGVGLVAHAGQRLAMNLHIFNASDGTLSGTSGIEARLLEPSAVQHEASVNYPGVVAFAIPSNGLPYSDTDTTMFAEARTVFAIFPHMHRLGTHFRARVLHTGAPATTIWDDDFQFESQELAAIPPVNVVAGDQLETTCTWVNTTGATVHWGDSTTAEMCFSIIMSY